MFARTVSLKRNVNWRDDRHVPAEARERDVADVRAVDRDAAARHVVETRDQVGERALAAAAHADQRHDVSGRDVEVDVLQDRRAGVVRELHAVEADAVVHPPQRDRPRPVGDVRLRVEQPERPLRAGEPLLDRVVRAHELLERLVEQRDGHEEGDECTGLATLREHALTAVPEDAGDRDAREHLGDRHRAQAARPHVQPEYLLVLRMEPVLLVFLLAERLHDAVALDVLVQHAVQPPGGLLLTAAVLPRPAGEEPDRQSGDGEEREREQRQDPVHVDRRADETDQRRRVLKDRLERVGERAADQDGVGGDPRDDLSRARAVEVCEVEPLQVAGELGCAGPSRSAGRSSR